MEMQANRQGLGGSGGGAGDGGVVQFRSSVSEGDTASGQPWGIEQRGLGADL